MAVTITPLGFKKPDGQELANTGENVISANAQTAEDVLAGVLSRLNSAEANIRDGVGGGGGSVSNVGVDTDGVPYYEIGASGTTISADTDGVPYFI